MSVGVRSPSTTKRRSAARGTATAGVPRPRPQLPVERAHPHTRPGRALAVGVPLALLGSDLAAFAGAVALTAAPTLKTLGLLALLLVVLAVGGFYRVRPSFFALDDAGPLLGRALAAGAAAMILAGVDDGVAGIARVRTSVLFGVLAIAGRAVVYAGIRAARRHHRLQQRVLLLGAGAVAGSLATTMLARPEYGLLPQGLVDDDPLLAADRRPVPLLGRYADLSATLLEHGIDVAVITFGSMRDPLVVDMIRACDRLSCEIYLVPRLYELHTVTRETEVIWGIPLLRLRRAPFRSWAWTGKRGADAVLAALAILLISPVLLACAISCRLETGRVVFRQTRIGLDGRPFTLLKFCTLRPTEDAESATRWSIAQDARVGRIGRLLRRTSLDELPQLWNVLRGDMSLVGPRPERPFFVDEFTQEFPWYMARHRVPAGLTGWAQIHGLRGDTSIGDRARFDNFYIENWSMWGDIKILLRTVTQVVKAAGR
jgi:exopolysaccharide biosynthesis polyprenyl glycosylphosphotransferase